MGDVYQATDSKLGRSVAVKFLSEAFIHDTERVARFQREARVLASLNHPNIAALYGLEESAGRTFLVMELVPGETLAQRILKGAIPVDETLTIGAQIAGALEAAHEKGITHRDLKPANIKSTADGTVKVLDFGLAKVSEFAPASSASDSPTLTIGATQTGVIMGTASYMSPEQARGRPVDKRADIWAFGVVLYELLTGQRLFGGEDISEILAKVIRDEPDLDAVPTDVRPLLRRCLEKDPKKRQRDIGDVRIELEHTLARRASSSRSATAAAKQETASNRLRLDIKTAAVLAGLLLVIGAIAGGLLWRGRPDETPEVVRLSVSMPGTMTGLKDVSISRALHTQFAHGGRSLVVTAFARKPDGTEEPRARIYTRRLDEYEFKPILGTDGARDISVSPDGEWVAFNATPSEDSSQLQLRKVRVEGGAPPVTIADWDESWTSFAWINDSALLVFSDGGTKFLQVPAGGGPATTPIKVDTGSVSGLAEPGGIVGDHNLFINLESWGPRGYQIDLWLLDIKTGKAQRLFESAGNAVYSPTGHVVFTRGESLMAAPFDVKKLAVTGEVAAVADGVRVDDEGVHGPFEISPDGSLLYPPGGRVGKDRQLVIVDPAGNVTPFTNERRTFELAPRISPDGRRVAVVLPSSRGTYEVWIADHSGLRRVAALPNADCSLPLWSPDGQRLAYIRMARDKDDGIYMQLLDGISAPQLILKSEPPAVFLPTSWSPDGSSLLAEREIIGGRGSDIVVVNVPAGGASAQPKDLLAMPATEADARISPDGRLVAFISDESGKFEIYVASYADGKLGAKLPVSAGANTASSNGPIHAVAWAADSRRLFYYAEPNKLMSVIIKTTPALSASAPVVAYDLSKLRVKPRGWDILPDGRLLAIQKGEGEDEINQYNIVLNWAAELRQRMAKVK